MKDTLFNIQSAQTKTKSNKSLIIFVIVDFVLLFASIILGIFGMGDDIPGRALASPYSSLGIVSMILLVLMIVSCVFTFFYWINHKKHI